MIMIKLPKELTTITPFSRLIAVVLFILLPITGFYLGTQYQESIDLAKKQTYDPTIISRKPTPTPLLLKQITKEEKVNLWIIANNLNAYGDPKDTVYVGGSPLFKEGEIWWCMVGENVGIEMGGKGDFFTRPILIFKKLSKDGFLGIPMSTQDKSGTWYVKVKQSGENVTVVLSQTKVFSSRRLYAKIGELDDVDCAKVGDAFFKLFTHSNQKFSPPSGGVVGKSQI